MHGSAPSPVEKIIAHFGGQSAMGRAIGKRQSTVWEWIKAGRIPYARIADVVAAAKRLDPPVQLSASDFVQIGEGE